MGQTIVRELQEFQLTSEKLLDEGVGQEWDELRMDQTVRVMGDKTPKDGQEDPTKKERQQEGKETDEKEP